MRSKNRKVRAIQDLKSDASLLNVRRALDALHDIPHEEMARVLGTSRSNVTSHIGGFRQTVDIQEGISTLWGVPRAEIF